MILQGVQQETAQEKQYLSKMDPRNCDPANHEQLRRLSGWPPPKKIAAANLSIYINKLEHIPENITSSLFFSGA